MQTPSLRRALRSTSGAALIEYVILLTTVSVVAIGAVFSTGTEVKHVYCVSNDEIREGMRFSPQDCGDQHTMAEAGRGAGEGGGDATATTPPEHGTGPQDPQTPTPPAIDPEPAPLTYGDLDFGDHILAAGHTATYQSLSAPSAGFPQPYHFRINSPEGDVEACVEPASGPLACALGGIAVPAGSQSVGYRATPLADTYAPYARALEASIGLTPGDTIEQWSFALTRAAMPLPLLAWDAPHTPHLTLPYDTTADHYVSIPLQGTIEGSVSADLLNTEAQRAGYDEGWLSVCRWAQAGGTPDCEADTNGILTGITQENTYAVGYVLRGMGQETIRPYGGSFALTLQSEQHPAVVADKPISVVREPSPRVMDWNLPEEITYTYPMGAVQPADFTQLYDFDAAFLEQAIFEPIEVTGDLRNPTVPSDGVRLCTRFHTQPSAMCELWSATTARKTIWADNESSDPGLVSFGFKIGQSMIDPTTKPFFGTMTVRVSLRDYPEEARTVRFTISRPEQGVDMDWDTSTESVVYPAGTTTNTTLLPYTMAYNGPVSISARAISFTQGAMDFCYQALPTSSVACVAVGTNVRTNIFAGSLHSYGFRVRGTNTLTSAMTGTARITLQPTLNGTSNGPAFHKDFAITRPRT